MKLGVIADVHGNEVALRAVLDDAARYRVDRWWVLGDLVMFGPRPAETLELLRDLPGVGLLRGNTDRYVLTGEQPAPRATAADAVGRLDLVERYAKMAAGIGWTRGVLDQAGSLDYLAALPAQLRLQFAGGTTILGVHASPGADDGPASCGSRLARLSRFLRPAPCPSQPLLAARALPASAASCGPRRARLSHGLRALAWRSSSARYALHRPGRASSP